MNRQVKEALEKAWDFQQIAEELFGAHESNLHAAHTNSETRQKVDQLKEHASYGSFLQALACAEIQQFQAAIVIAWIGVMDFLQHLACKHSSRIREKTTGFPNNDIEALRNKITDADLINILTKSDLLTNQRTKNLKGLLNDRNGAAHPSDALPTQSIALGAIQKMANEIIAIEKREANQA
tara:strand:- start:538 stop:1080 length:543 start_codon:yes stop_codon:yes gene_type:complete